CPHDMDAGAFVLDDDVAEVFAAIPAGVNVTCFIDCCHSGTVSRFGVGSAAAGRSRAADERPRFLAADRPMIEAHRRFRSQLGWRRAAVPRGPESMREVLFSACRSTELAWESNGQGEFTLRATRILASGIGGLTNERFAQRVRREIGPNPRQHPELDCAPAAASRGLLQPVGAPALVAAGGGAGSSSPSLGELLRRIADLSDGRGRTMSSNPADAGSGAAPGTTSAPAAFAAEAAALRPIPVKPGARADARPPRFEIGPRVYRAARVRPYSLQPGDPLVRPLRIFTLDPATSVLDGAVAEVDVPYEPVAPGPVGALFEIDPVDGVHGVRYRAVNLDDPRGPARPGRGTRRTSRSRPGRWVRSSSSIRSPACPACATAR